MAEAGRTVWVHLVQPLLQQGHPEQAAQDRVQAASEDLQGGRPHSVSVPVLRHLHLFSPSKCLSLSPGGQFT